MHLIDINILSFSNFYQNGAHTCTMDFNLLTFLMIILDRTFEIGSDGFKMLILVL